MKRAVLFMVFFFMQISLGHAGIKSQQIEYKAGNTTLIGYLSYDDSFSGLRPGVLVVHEWWGNGKYTRFRADMLARLGYIALAVDMYGDGKQADHPDDAKKFASEVSNDIGIAKTRFLAALRLLKNQSLTDPEKIAAIGYCLGGGVVLNMARSGVDIQGVVSFHGSLSTNMVAEPGTIKAAILVLNGGNDPFVTPEILKQFEAEMRTASARFRIINYPGAWHSFTNPEAGIYGEKFNLPLVYNRQADLASWEEMQVFFKDIFK